ncbi:hypothetical protein F8388_007984 [Cannabis sativa]|uniref:Uncharacterized protein n=1 Tax=Cannabis sativa TaxID=3483 RepID=A0A7J6FTW8_CANSA|nr:hypothetical protein F8388_007984 [Cannabis sativa]
MMKGMKLVGVKVVIMATIIVGCMLEGALGVCNMSEDGLNACRPAVVKNQPAPLTKKCCDALRGANLVCEGRTYVSPWSLINPKMYEEHAIVGGESSNHNTNRASKPTGDSESKRKTQNAGALNLNDDVG